MSDRCKAYLDANAFWDFARTPRFRTGNLRLTLDRFKRFVTKHRDRINLHAPCFAELEFVHKRRDEEYCKYLIDHDIVSSADLAKHRMAYFEMAPDQLRYVGRSKGVILDEIANAKEWIQVDTIIPVEAFTLARELVFGTPLSIFDALELASSIVADSDIFVSNDKVFGLREKGQVASQAIHAVLRDGKEKGLFPETYRLPKFVDHRNPDALEDILLCICTHEQRRMSPRFLGQVRKAKTSSKFHKDLVFYEHASSNFEIACGMRVAAIGRRYSRRLLVREIHDDAGSINGYKCTATEVTKLLSLWLVADRDSEVDGVMALPDDKVYYEH